MGSIKDSKIYIVVCEGMKSEHSECYDVLIEELGKGLTVCTDDVFLKKEQEYIPKVRYGFFMTSDCCGNAIQVLLEENIPVILIESKHKSTDKTLYTINKALSLKDEAKMTKGDLGHLIFKIGEKEKIKGAIAWAEGFYPYMHEKTKKKIIESHTRKELLDYFVAENVLKKSY